MRVTVGSIVFDSAPSDPDEAYVLTRMTGWFGAAGIRREETQRPAAHGSFDAQGFRGAKVPMLEGTIVARTPSQLAVMSRNLEGLLADGGVTRMTVQDERGATTWQDVRLAQPAVVTDFGDGETADFQIGFWAPVPEIYGGLITFSGSPVTLFHRGTIPSPIIVRIPSAPSGYTINGPGGRQFVVSGATAGGVHEVDLRRGRVTRDGVLMQGVVTRADTWDLAPGPGVGHSISAGSPTWLVHDTFA